MGEYNKASLVKVVDIVIQDPVFGLYILYKVEPVRNSLWIFTQGPLVVVSTRITRAELRLAPYEVVSPELADG